MSDDNANENFDLDSGVAEIAESMGFDSPNDDELIDELPAEEPKVIEEVVESDIKPRHAPASWTKEQHDNWAKMPKEAQEYVELREKQMLDGIEQYKQGYQQALEINSIIEPFRGSLQKHGIDEKTAIKNLFGHHIALTEGTKESREAAFVALGQNLGIIPQEGRAAADPMTHELQQRLERIERQEQQRLQQFQQQHYLKVEQEVKDFADDPENEYFEEVADDVLLLLKTGLDLPTAYEKAVWSNPITRAKELAKTTKAQTEKATQSAKIAKKAISVNVRPINSSKSSNEPAQSWDQTMAETLASLRSQ